MPVNERAITLAVATVCALTQPTALAISVFLLKPANAKLYYQIAVASVALVTLLIHKAWKAPRSRFGRKELYDLSEYTQEQFDALRVDHRVGRLVCCTVLITFVDLVACISLTEVLESTDSFLDYAKKNWFVCFVITQTIILNVIGDISYRRKIANAKVLTEEASTTEKGSVDNKA